MTFFATDGGDGVWLRESRGRFPLTSVGRPVDELSIDGEDIALGIIKFDGMMTLDVC